MICKALQTLIFEKQYAFTKFTQSFTYSAVLTYPETLNSNSAPLEIYKLNFSKSENVWTESQFYSKSCATVLSQHGLT